MWPGCNRPASKADLDHAMEYDHDNPAVGGQTTPHGLVTLCRFHHLVKTFGTFLTDLFISRDGRTRTTVTTPEGLTIDGPVHTGEDMLRGLTDIEFAEPPNAPPTPREEDHEAHQTPRTPGGRIRPPTPGTQTKPTTTRRPAHRRTRTTVLTRIGYRGSPRTSPSRRGSAPPMYPLPSRRTAASPDD